MSEAISQQIDRLLTPHVLDRGRDSGPVGGPDRGSLVASCVRFRDQLAERFPQQADLLGAALDAAGVRELLADGQPFDGRMHEAVETAPTDDPALHDVVSKTVRCGYVDGDHVLRVPRVVVYRLVGDAS